MTLSPEKIVVELSVALGQAMEQIGQFSEMHRGNRQEQIVKAANDDGSIISFANLYDQVGAQYIKGFMDMFGPIATMVEGFGHELIAEKSSDEVIDKLNAAFGPEAGPNLAASLRAHFQKAKEEDVCGPPPTDDMRAQFIPKNPRKDEDPRNAELAAIFQKAAPMIENLTDYGPPGESSEQENELS